MQVEEERTTGSDYYAAMLAHAPNGVEAAALWLNEGIYRRRPKMVGVYCCPKAAIVERDGRKFLHCDEHPGMTISLADLGLAATSRLNWQNPRQGEDHAVARALGA